jgi:SAM-dependent methyltransferase
MARIAQSEGRDLFGLDPASYELGRPGHPEGVYRVLRERCGLREGARILEVGPGTGQATRRLVELGAEPIVVVEPNEPLGAHLEATLGDCVEVVGTSLEDSELSANSFDLAVAASSFHWVEEAVGLRAILVALRADGWVALWWTLFGEGSKPDAFMCATTALLEGLDSSPTKGRDDGPPHGLDRVARVEALAAAGFDAIEHELFHWEAHWDAPGIRALYGSFSPILKLDAGRRTAILDGIERIAADDFGNRVSRMLTTSLYTARKPS